MLVCVAGMPGAGKSLLADYLVGKGYEFVRFGQITLDEVKRRGLAPTEANERQVREEFRKKDGMAAYAVVLYPKFKQLLEKHPVVADGLYAWSEYKYLKERLGQQMLVVAVYAPPDLRYKRISNRVMPKSDTELRNRPFTVEEAKKRDFAEIEHLEKGGPIVMADYTIVNTGSLVDYKKEMERFYRELLLEFNLHKQRKQR
jgi:dephospho-CoA kinase